MNLLEHEGKALFEQGGLPVLPSRLLSAAGAASLEGLALPVVVKAQVPAGGRGKAGGVRLCHTPPDVTQAIDEIVGTTIGGHVVKSVLVEEAVEIAHEMYLAIMLSRRLRGPLLLFSTQGGMDIEQVASASPDDLLRLPIDPLLGICDYQVRDVVARAAAGCAPAGLTPETRRLLTELIAGAWRLYRDSDALLLEINPLVITADGSVVCLDSKVTIDDNASFRHQRLFSAPGHLSQSERRAQAAGLSYVQLDGTIGVLGNGAGMVMSLLDQIAAAGGRAANFCDAGGGVRALSVGTALELILSSGEVHALLVNIFGGITRCDEVARGLVAALAKTATPLPVAVRLDGNAADAGREVLAAAALPNITVAETTAAAVLYAVEAARAGAAAPAPSLRAEGGG